MLSAIEDELLERPFYALVINISQLAAQVCAQHNKKAKDLLLGAIDEERQKYAEILDAIRKREGYTNKESHAGKFIGEAVSIIMNNIPKYIEMYNVEGKKMDFVIK